MNIYKGYEGDAIPVQLLVKSLNDQAVVKVTEVTAEIKGAKVSEVVPGFSIKGDNVVHGLIGPESYKYPGAYVAFVKCTFDDGSSRTFAVNVDVMSKDELVKQTMLNRWNALSEQHRRGVNVVPEATRLLKSMEEAGYLTDFIKKQMDDIDIPE